MINKETVWLKWFLFVIGIYFKVWVWTEWNSNEEHRGREKEKGWTIINWGTCIVNLHSIKPVVSKIYFCV